MSSSRNDFPIVHVKNYPFGTSNLELFEFFGKYGNIHQIRTNSSQPGTCFIIYKNLINAQRAAQELNGVNFNGRYIITSMYQIDKSKINQQEMELRQEQLNELKQKYSIK
ncbi:conserved hypothetical protein [Candida tropicalis MYA-3404]|uniref:RRM domain-containing protein n=1 Tax=Candida tropicalis (strain ATCC MYA-3404 / T1) TaxID=294747 RepID=C5M9G5_CANTT|nr:conserved hypothetical protein [Candida tropicalis MYA-3404]EER33309.1 conserved hypothetical protein [Candida tropicalis MYA-3404]KAG4407143.1 hypothetical protein JTP64_002678 [Candida tropicalis]MCP8717459.1 RNA recognition motif domain-containing protein [Asgard group archaeon]